MSTTSCWRVSGSIRGRLVATYPLGPVMEGAGLNVTVLSYLGNMDFGFMACAELVPDVWDLAEHIETSMAELLAAAKGATRATRAGG